MRSLKSYIVTEHGLSFTDEDLVNRKVLKLLTKAWALREGQFYLCSSKFLEECGISI